MRGWTSLLEGRCGDRLPNNLCRKSKHSKVSLKAHIISAESVDGVVVSRVFKRFDEKNCNRIHHAKVVGHAVTRVYPCGWEPQHHSYLEHQLYPVDLHCTRVIAFYRLSTAMHATATLSALSRSVGEINHHGRPDAVIPRQ